MPNIVFDLGSNAITERVLSDSKSFQMNSLEYTQILSVSESNNFVFFSFLRNRKNGLGVHVKENYRSYLANKKMRQRDITNDLDHGPGFWPRGTTSDGKLFQMVQSFDLIESVNNNHGCSEELKLLCEKLSPTDNPVVMVLM